MANTNVAGAQAQDTAQSTESASTEVLAQEIGVQSVYIAELSELLFVNANTDQLQALAESVKSFAAKIGAAAERIEAREVGARHG